MQVTVEETGALERQVTIQVPAENIDDKVHSRLREVGKQVRIKGFRPGHIPMKVLRQRYGKGIRQEVVGQVMQESLQKAIEDESLRPVGRPEVNPKPESLKSGDLEFVATFEVFPPFETIDVSTLDIQRPTAEVSDADVDGMLTTLQMQRREWRSADATAADGDRVSLNLAMVSADGRFPAEGSDAVKLVVGEGATFDALEDAIRGVSPGDEESFDATLPENFGEPSLAGKAAHVQIEITAVESPVLPEVDEAFAASFGIADGSLEQLREEIRRNLERELEQATMSALKLQIVDKLVAAHDEVPVPESAVAAELAGLKARAESRQQAVDEAALEPLARQRVAAGILMSEIARQNALNIDPRKVREAIEKVAATYEEPQAVVELYYREPQLLDSVQNAVLEERVVEWVLDHASVEEQSMEFNEVIALAAQRSR